MDWGAITEGSLIGVGTYEFKWKRKQRKNEAKTRKILALSGGIASTSNVIFVAVNSYLGNSHAKRYLDLGGFSVVLMRLFTDATFIYSVKEEFIRNKYIEGLRGL